MLDYWALTCIPAMLWAENTDFTRWVADSSEDLILGLWDWWDL